MPPTKKAAATAAATDDAEIAADAEAEQHALCDAARDHVWSKVKSMINKKPALVNSAPAGRYTPLHQAAEFGSLDICKFLVKHGASLMICNNDGRTALEIAHDKCKDFLVGAEQHEFLDLARERKWSEVKAMLERKPELLECQVAGRWSALHQAAEAGSVEMCKHLLGLGASLDATTQDGKTPLSVAHKSCKAVLSAASSASGKHEDEDEAEGGHEGGPPSKKPKVDAKAASKS